MVVVSENDVDGTSDTKSTLFRGTSISGSTSHIEPPPVYSSREQSFPSHPQILPHHVPLLSPSNPERGRRATRRRFFGALVLAALFYIIFLSFFGGAIRVNITSSPVFLKITNNSLAVTMPHGPPAGPTEEDGNIISCYPQTDLFHSNQQILDTSEPPYSKFISFSVPSSSELVYFLSRGDYGVGSFRFELSDKDGDHIEVEVTMKYHREEILEHSQVCSLERGDGERGIGFFTPFHENKDPRSHHSNIHFNSTVRFPRSGVAGNPLVIKALTTNMGVWTHILEDFEGLVSFMTISLKGTVAPILASGVSTVNGAFVTSVGAISGSFNASESLILNTSVGAVSANVLLNNKDGNQPTKLNVTTSVGSVNANISLVSISPSKDSNNPSFYVAVQSGTAPLNIAFLDAPTDPFAKLTLSAHTLLGPANVVLHPTYEGTIIQRTSWLSRPRLMENEATEDPSGEHRRRSVSRNVVGTSSEARVWWGEDTGKTNYGSAIVTTSMSPNNVILN